ncbi:UNVERIFIED_CONTAM: hypothetical protein HDU68_006363 [Siphonaria sp. JEL0065]|nr:hypothetical protein HDU68_006363 [Siphonaria sp. JEL0065]
MFSAYLLILAAFLATSVQAQCENLGNGSPISQFNTYLPAPLNAVTSDSFKNCLKPGQLIGGCWRLTSPSGQTGLLLQPDGNAVIYSIWYNTLCNTGLGCVTATWNAGTNGKAPHSIQLGLGRFFVSTSAAAGYSGNQVVWDSMKQGSTVNTLLCMQNDGNLVVYDNGNAVVWTANTKNV